MTRVVSGAVLLVIAIAVVWYAPAALFFIVAEGLLILACREYVGLARANRLQVPAALTIVATALVCATFTNLTASDFAFRGIDAVESAISLDVIMLASLLALGSYQIFAWRPGTDAVGSVAAATLPLLYLGLPIGSMVAIREMLGGPQALFLMMLTVFVSDTAQYYSGRAFGTRHLAPAISPKKTIEGAIGGVIFGTLALTVVGAWWLTRFPAGYRALLGTVMVVAGILGDLFESMLKRSAGVKDSSALIPGHGGILDRIDALLFVAPLYYIVLKYV